MSVERLPLPVDHGEAWTVSWRDEKGYLRSRLASSEAEARIMAADVKLKQASGELAALELGGQTLREFVAEISTSPDVRMPREALNRPRMYHAHLNDSILPQLGELRLADLTPASIKALLEPSIGDQAVLADVKQVLFFVLDQAVRRQCLRVNPTLLEKPDVVELMRNWLLGVGRFQDAVLVTTLAYAGLRFEEAVALEWRHICGDTLVVERALVGDELRNLEPDEARTVALIPPLAVELEQLTAVAERSDLEAFVFSPPHERGEEWNQWQREVFRPAAELAGATGMEPSDLRNVFLALNRDKGETAGARVCAIRKLMVQGDPGRLPSSSSDSGSELSAQARAPGFWPEPPHR